MTDRDQGIEAVLAALRAIGMDPSDVAHALGMPAMAPEALAPVLEQIRAQEREACIAALENLDRTGRDWVRGSLWSNIFRDGINAIRARGAPVLICRDKVGSAICYGVIRNGACVRCGTLAN